MSKKDKGPAALTSVPGITERQSAANEKDGASDQEQVVEAKSAVVTSDLIKSGHLRVPGLRGGYKDAHFGDDHVSTRPVSPETAAQLRADYPKLTIEEFDK